MIGGSPSTNHVQRLSLSASGVVSRLQDGPRLPVDSVITSSIVVDKQTRITNTGGSACLNGSRRYDLVWHLETADINPQWTLGPNLLTGRRFHISFRLGTNLYVGMGYDGSRYLSSLEKLDTTQSSPVWQYSLPNYPLRLHRAACVVMQGQDGVDEVWVAGGLLGYPSTRTNAVYSWRGPGYSWHQEASMTRGRDDHAMAVHGTNIFAMGGWDTEASNTMEMYHNGTWSLLSYLPATLAQSGSVVWGDYLVVVAGYGPKIGQSGGGPRDSALVMDIKSGNWSESNSSLSQGVWLCAVGFTTA